MAETAIESMETDVYVVGADPEESMDTMMLDGNDEEVLYYDEDSPNLVATFMGHKDGVEALRKIAQKVKMDFDSAKESSEEYRKEMANNFRLFTGDLPVKDYPYRECANVHVPVMIENVMRITTRLMAELFGDWQSFFAVMPTGPDDEAQADAMTLHGNWQLREDIPDFQRQMERAVMLNVITGDVTCHSFWDYESKRNRHEVLTPDEFFTPYSWTTTMPDYSDCPYVIKVLHQYRHHIQSMEGVWENTETVLRKGNEPSVDDEPDEPLRETLAEVHGQNPDESGRSAPYKLLHYEGWDDGLMPNQSRDRYIQVIMDPRTNAILKLSIHEEADWKERARYNYQRAELEQYRMASANFAMAQQSADMLQQKNPMGTPGMAMGGPQAAAPVAPTPPLWLRDPDDPMAAPEPAKKSPILMFTHGVGIEPMSGNLGLGYGKIQADYNRSANIMMNQAIDSATMANCWTILKTDRIQFNEDFELAPGKVNTLRGVSGDDLNKHFVELKPSPANPQLSQFVDKVYDWGQSSMQAPAVLSGESGKSGETYRGLSARIEQATKQLSVTGRKYANTFLKPVLMNNARLNATFLPEDEMRILMNWKTGTPQQISISRRMYERDYNVEIRSDLRFTSEAQRLQEAQEMLGMSMNIPELQMNSRFRYEAVKQILTASRRHDMIRYLGAEPPMASQFTIPQPPTAPEGPPAPPPSAPPQGS